MAFIQQTLCMFVISLYGQIASGLINGTAITNGQFAAHVILSLPNGKTCGGEVIDSAHILTASTCIFNEYNELLSPNVVTVSGKWNLTASTLTPQLIDLNVAAIYAHPQYDPYSKENDIAVLRLATDLPLEAGILQPSMSKADLTTRIVADSTSCLLAGLDSNDSSSELSYTRLPIFNRIECNQNEEYTFEIKDKMICAGTTTSDSLICEVDIGSGLYCNGNLTGILSFGAGCGNRYPGVFTQVRMYNHWIRQQLRRSDIPRAGPTPPPSNNRSSGSHKRFGILLLIVTTALLNNLLEHDIGSSN